MAAARTTPMAIEVQKAVSRCLLVIVSRWISARPKPESTKTVASARTVVASATRPKSSGESSRPRTTRTTRVVPRAPHLSTIDQETDFVASLRSVSTMS
jgi:hypothetical protein